MVNLLFISNNPKIEIIKNALQPVLKLKIDVVGDFDYGLRDVFEKRPAVVFIQDQIAGVTGESVARHIQMLLGSGAPSFIYMHDGNLKSKAINGLYDYLIDLSQDNQKLLADTHSTLKSLLGPKWLKIYSPLKTREPVAAASLTEEHRDIADQQVDGSISERNEVSDNMVTGKPLDFVVPGTLTEEPFYVVSSTHDQLDEILATSAVLINENEKKSAVIPDSGIKKGATKVETTLSAAKLSPATIPLKTTGQKPQSAFEVPDNSNSEQATLAAHSVSAMRTDSSPASPSQKITPADFRIKREHIGDDAGPGESLRVFEADCLAKPSSRNWYLAVAGVLCVGLIVAGWFMVRQKPYLLRSVIKESVPVKDSSTPAQPVTPAPAPQKQLPVTQRPETVAMPSFIPIAGHDRSFASQKPGWERYVGTDTEYRLYRSGGKLKAVQVMATKGHVIGEPKLKAILIELTGAGEYRVASREQKLGFQLSRASVNGKADVLIYRKKSMVHAFVVSLN